jgi:hypothetical protein
MCEFSVQPPVGSGRRTRRSCRQVRMCDGRYVQHWLAEPKYRSRVRSRRRQYERRFEAIVAQSSGTIVGFSDASRGSHANQLGAVPNEGITSAVGAYVGAKLVSRQIVER